MIPFVGPSYQLNNRKADVQRTVNMYPKAVESGTGRAQYFLKSVPGLVERFNLAGKEVRGFASIAGGRSFVVFGDAVAEISADFTVLTGLATLTTSTGPVCMAVGRDHLVVADGTDRAVYYQFSASAGFVIVNANFYASSWVAYIGGRFVFGRDGTDQFFWSGIDDPTSYDALDFATAESSPDGLVWGTVYREELWLLGTGTVEVWRLSANADSAFEKNQGVSISVGCVSGQTVRALDNSLFWLGEDDNGGPIVYRVQGYSPARVSTYAVEEKMQAGSDLSSSSAWCYQRDGMAFYCLNVPGLSSTWCFEVQGMWHERADFVSGEFNQYRARNHVYTNGRHLVGTLTGYIYELDESAYTNAGDVLCRERTSPHMAASSLARIFFQRFRLECSVAQVTDDSEPEVELYISNDGGYSWSFAMPRSLGRVGEYTVIPQWNRLGAARDRVWRLRCTDNVKFDIVNVDVTAEQAMA